MTFCLHDTFANLQGCHIIREALYYCIVTLLGCTQMCRFLSQEVRENRGHFIALTARVSPLCLIKFQARISNFYS